MTTMPTPTLAQPINIAAKNIATIQQCNTTIVSPSSNSSNNSATTPLVHMPVVSPSDSASIVINGREARNLAEKHRRDKLNASISELAKMLPRVADSSRRLDKTSVLRLTTHGLRLHYVFGKSAARRKALQKGDSHRMTDTLLQLLDSFFITLTCHGQIVLISSNVENLLGHCQSDLYGQNILQITHPEDQEMLRQELIPSDIESLFYDYHNSSKTSTSNQDVSNTTSEPLHHAEENDSKHAIQNEEIYLAEIDEKLRADKRCFTVRLSRASNRSESKKIYEVVKIDGCFRRSDFSSIASGACNYPIVSQLIRRSRNNSSTSSVYSSNNENMGTGVFMPHLLQHDAIAQAALHGVSGNDIVLVAMARIIRSPKIMNYSLDENRLEYKTRHLIDGRIIDCDNRIGLVAGYLKEEVRNLSPFSFIHQDDVRWVIVALRQMYDCNSDYGESCFRLLSRNGKFIYINTKGYLEIDRGTNKVHSFLCVNTLLNEEEGKRRVQEMKKKFSMLINAKVPTNTMQDAPASQNPQQLERIVLYLIENLQKRQSNTYVVDEIHSEEDANRHTNTPPLALVPPEAASVKNSISKSVSAVISTAAKSFVAQNNVNNKNGLNIISESNKSDRINNLVLNEQRVSTSTQTTNNNDVNPLQRPSVLQMNTKYCQKDLCSNSPNKIENTQHNSVLKRLHVDITAETTLKDDEYQKLQPAKRTLSYSSSSSTSSPFTCSFSNSCLLSPNERSDDEADIHDFITSSLCHVGESLESIDSHTSNLRQHCSSLPICLDNKLDAIIIEQKKQSEFLTNIKNEYEVYKECPNSTKYTEKRSNKNQQLQLSSLDVV